MRVANLPKGNPKCEVTADSVENCRSKYSKYLKSRDTAIWMLYQEVDLHRNCFRKELNYPHRTRNVKLYNWHSWKLGPTASNYWKSGGTFIWGLHQKLDRHTIFFAKSLTTNWETEISIYSWFSWKFEQKFSKPKNQQEPLFTFFIGLFLGED